MLATALAVIFGVGFVAGTLIFGDTARAGFFDTFARTAKNIDVAIEPPAASDNKGDQPLLSAAQLAAVRALPDVAVADARMVTSLAMVGADGKLITNSGRVGVAISTDGDARLRGFDVRGRLPARADEAMVDTDTAAHQHLQVGRTITVVDTKGVRHAYTLSGLIDFATSKRFSGESVVGLPASQIATLTGQTGLDEIVGTARTGVSQSTLAGDVKHALGSGPRVFTGDQRRTDLANDATKVASQFVIVLSVFGAISLIVATFVIYNTFAILLAQRVRETALLRCVGATRRQVFTSVLVEAAVIGLIGGVAGIVLGFGVAYGLLGLLNGVLGAGIPVHGIVLTATPIVAGLAIALVVTVAAALLPAVRATRTSPLAALRDLPSARAASRVARVFRFIAGGVFAALGVLITASGTNNSDAQSGTFSIVAGGVVTFLAVLIWSPLFIGPLTAAIGALPARLFGTPARLATANARRNPGRTAITSATLMIGVGLMSLFSVLIASIQVTANQQLTGHYPVDYVMTGVQYGGGRQATIPPAYAQAVRARGEFAAVAEARTVDARVDGVAGRVAAIDPGSLGSLIRPTMTSGKIGDLRTGTAVTGTIGQTRPVGRGGRITVTAGGHTVTLSVIGTASTFIPGAVDVDALVSWDQLNALVGPGEDSTVMVKDAPGVSPTASRDVLNSISQAYPLIEVDSTADLSSSLDNAVNGLIALFGGLLGTAVLIALFGITNTLSLSVVERTRESATVRALGLTRGQLRATLLVEALLMGVVGALVGIVYGLIYGRIVISKAFSAIGPTIVIPWGWLIGLVVLAAGAATLAAVLPARRAAKASIVSAMAET